MFKRRNNTLQAGLSIQDNALTVAIEHGKNAQPQLLEAHCLSMAPDKPAQQVFDDAKYFVGTGILCRDRHNTADTSPTGSAGSDPRYSNSIQHPLPAG